jgi:hypothetical protein
MPDTMVHTNQWFVPKKTQHPGGNSHTLKGGSHSWTFGIAYAVNIVNLNASLSKSLFDQWDDPGTMMLRGILREESLPWFRDMSSAYIT